MNSRILALKEPGQLRLASIFRVGMLSPLFFSFNGRHLRRFKGRLPQLQYCAISTTSLLIVEERKGKEASPTHLSTSLPRLLIAPNY